MLVEPWAFAIPGAAYTLGYIIKDMFKHRTHKPKRYLGHTKAQLSIEDTYRQYPELRPNFDMETGVLLPTKEELAVKEQLEQGEWLAAKRNSARSRAKSFKPENVERITRDGKRYPEKKPVNLSCTCGCTEINVYGSNEAARKIHDPSCEESTLDRDCYCTPEHRCRHVVQEELRQNVLVRTHTNGSTYYTKVDLLMRQSPGMQGEYVKFFNDPIRKKRT